LISIWGTGRAAMIEFWGDLWFADLFIPHGHCYLWKPELVSLHAVSDLSIALSYYSIPCSLFYIAQNRKDFPYSKIIWLFGAFILACGTTHLMEIWTLWHASYWFSGLLKAATATISVLTAFELIPHIDKVLALPSPSKVEALNTALKAEIHERKQMESALKAEEARYRAIVENQSELICRFLPDSKITFANEAFCEYFRKTREELVGYSYQPVVYEADLERVDRLLGLMSPENPVLTIENRIVVEGEVRWTQWNNRMILNEQNELTEFQAVGRDITTLKQKEEKLRLLSEERLQLALEASGDSLWDWDIAHGKVYLSPQMLDMLGLDKKDIGNQVESWIALIHPLDKELVMQCQQEHLKDSTAPYDVEYRIKTKSGQWKWIASTGKVVVRDEQGSPLRAVGVHRDIDERKQVEIEIQNSLYEKNTLLKEIHHRVKNNLQVICSLLHLQSRFIQDQTSKAQFDETQNRVKSMALVHEKLYRSESLSKINMAEHVQELLGDLRRSFGKQAENVDLQVEIAPNYLINMDMAIPFGLIINELVSNSFKYAFEPNQDKKIWIRASLNEEDTLSLNIRDNGRGMPLQFNLDDSKTLGLQLVSDLTEQLDGTFKFKNSNGASFFITLSCIE
jgi:PAS domain S-box-containing protein